MTRTERPRFNYTVASLGNRTHYQVPQALHLAGALDGFVTDFYTPDLVYRYRHLLPAAVRDMCSRRHDEQLPSNRVRSRLLAYEARRRLSGEIDQVPYVGPLDWRLGQVAAKLSARRATASLIYSLYWPGFKSAGMLSRTAPQLIWQEHPTPSQVRRIANAARQKGWYEGVEPEDGLTPAEVDTCERLTREADGIIVACDFIRQGLLEIGVPSSRIAVVPLGGDRLSRTVESVDADELARARTGPLKILWVGQPVARKGFRQLLAALRQLPPDRASVTFLFPSSTSAPTLPDGLPPYRIHRHVTDQQLQALYLAHDLLVMPSLYEGFGMVYSEALNAGLPIVCTWQTGVASLITHGSEGWVIDTGDEDALRDTLDKAVCNPEAVRAMRVAAARLAALHPWSQFRTQLVAAIVAFEATWEAR